jgi:hypothetical protein
MKQESKKEVYRLIELFESTLRKALTESRKKWKKGSGISVSQPCGLCNSFGTNQNECALCNAVFGDSTTGCGVMNAANIDTRGWDILMPLHLNKIEHKFLGKEIL